MSTDYLDLTLWGGQPLRQLFWQTTGEISAVFDPAYRDDLNTDLTRHAHNASYKFKYQDASEITLNVGEVVAYGLQLLLDEADAYWSTEIDVLFDRNLAGTLPSGPEFKAESDKLDARTRNRRNKITQAACGVSYAQYIKALA